MHGKAVAEKLRPGADDLLIDALLIEPGAPLGDGFDQAWKERAHLEAIVEMQRRRRGAGSHQPHADLLAAAGDRVDQLRRNVVGMNVDRHALSSDFVWRSAGD